MYRKRKNSKKHFLLLCVIFIISLTLIYLSVNRENNYLFLEKITHDIGGYVGGIFIPKRIEVEEEVLDGVYQELEIEVNTLKQMLELDTSNYKLIHASVIKREDDWYQELIINKGENDGISIDMAVVANGGLIGKIVKTTSKTSHVKLLSSNSMDMKISVSINNYHGILDTYDKETNTFIVNIKKDSEIKIGDSIYTNGLGGVYPAGIYIGKVNEITYDTLGLQKQLKINPDTSYDNISYVTVMDRS